MKRLVLAVMLGTLVGCGSASDKVLQNDLVDALEKRNWVPLAFPDSTFSPGSIVVVENDKSVEWLGTLDSELCRIPQQYLTATSDYSGALSLKDGYTASINLAATIKGVGVTAGAGADTVSIVKVEDQGPYNLDAARLITWLRDNRDTVNPTCLDWFKQDNNYLVYRAFAIKKGTIAFKRKVDGELRAIAPEFIKQIVKVDADAGAQWNQEGELVIQRPAFIAVRGIRSLLTNVVILGDEAEGEKREVADALRSQGERVLRPPQ